MVQIVNFALTPLIKLLWHYDMAVNEIPRCNHADMALNNKNKILKNNKII